MSSRKRLLQTACRCRHCEVVIGILLTGFCFVGFWPCVTGYPLTIADSVLLARSCSFAVCLLCPFFFSPSFSQRWTQPGKRKSFVVNRCPFRRLGWSLVTRGSGGYQPAWMRVGASTLTGFSPLLISPFSPSLVDLDFPVFP